MKEDLKEVGKALAHEVLAFIGVKMWDGLDAVVAGWQKTAGVREHLRTVADEAAPQIVRLVTEVASQGARLVRRLARR